MSSIDSFSFLSAIAFGRDLVWRFRKNADVNQWVQVGLVLTAVISILFIFALPSVIKMWYNLGSLFIPPLLLPLTAAYFPKIKLNAQSTFYIMLSSFAISLSWLIGGLFHKQAGFSVYPLALEPFFPGLLWSVFWYGVLNLKKS